jgi:hypothetical protein
MAPRLRVLRGVAYAACLGPLSAAAPKLDQLFPIAVPAGTTTVVSAAGKFDPWPVDVWTDSPGIVIRAEQDTGKFSVEVGAGVAIGPHLIRAYNSAGAGVPRFVIVTTSPDLSEVEPNDEVAKAQRIDHLPATISGRLGKGGDVDSYAVTLEAGGTLHAALDAYILASPVDAVLRLVDAAGRELALNHDNGRNLDPALTWTAPAAGTFVLQVFGFAHPATSDVKFTGSDACVYRLHLGRETPPRPTPPPGEGTVWSAKDFPAGTAERPAPTAPFAVDGAITQVGEENSFTFAATKGDALVFAIHSAALGLPLDAWLAVRNSAGKELTRNDDSAGADPLVEWTAPETGPFTVVVGSVLHRAGPDYRYRLTVRTPRPRVIAAIADPGFTVEPGKSASVKVTVRRFEGWKTKLVAAVTGLPDDVCATPVELGPSAKEATLQLTADPAAKPFSGPIRIVLREENSDTVRLAVHELISTALDNGVPQGFRDLVIPTTDQVWLTVPPAPPAKATPPPKTP